MTSSPNIQAQNDIPRPPHNEDHVACSKPNPPWWCVNNAPLDGRALDYLVFAGMILGIGYVYSQRNEE